MQRRASSSHGATMASVGHTSIQAVQLPQCSVAGASAGQRQVGVELAEKKPGAGAAMDQVGVFADPAQACIACQRFLEYWRAVDEGPITEVADARLDPLGQLLQPATQHLVIIAAEGIARDKAEFGILDHRPGIARVRRQVVHARGDHGHGARTQRVGAAATLSVACHIVHVAVAAGVEPSLQPRLVLAQIRAGDADLLKAQLPAPGLDLDGETLESWIGLSIFHWLRRVLA